MHTSTPFKLCLTMAGAVSAGAYTAGVIDYLLETLARWQTAKDENHRIKKAFPDSFLENGYDPSVPMHDLQIEVVSGASAGGITSTLTFLSLLEGIRIDAPGEKSYKDNKLYQTWVELADTPEKDTLLQLLSNDDIDSGEPLESLLNTNALDIIAANAIQETNINAYPSYVAKDLDLFLTVSNLRGLRYKVLFTGNAEEGQDTSHYITAHSGFFRYRMENATLKAGIPEDENQLYHVLQAKEDKTGRFIEKVDLENLKRATLSTAAFPLGLKSRLNHIPSKYLDRYKKYLFDDPDCVESEKIEDEIYTFRSVDGGLLNNEPFGYTSKILAEKHPYIGKQTYESTGHNNNYAIIMIDPFPNANSEDAFNTEDKGIIDVAKQVFGALRNQVLFRQDDIFAALNQNQNTRFLIAPIRKDGDKKEQDRALACGSLAGFSGFLSKEFRAHDFELGRKNCQSFIRYHFALKETDIPHKLNHEIPFEAMERFRFSRPPAAPRSLDGVNYYFPIIPDVKLDRAYTESIQEGYGREGKLADPVFPKIDINELENKYKKAAIGRIKGIRKYYLKEAKWYYKIGASLARLDKKAYRILFKAIEDGLRKQGLLK